MNRPFKFRAWFAKAQVFLPVEWLEFWEHANGETYATVHTRTDFERGGWFSRVQEHTNRLTSLDGNKTQVPRVHLMQYTGLLDKNGTEIYEGDIVASASPELIFQVVYKAPSFCRKWIDDVSKRYRDPVEPMAWNTHIICEVIGNIYENPELIEEV